MPGAGPPGADPGGIEPFGVSRRFFELSDDLFAVLDVDGVVREANPAWTSVLGLPPSAVIGRHIGTFLDRNDPEARGTVWARFPQGFEGRFLHRDGSARWIHWRARIDLDERLAYAVGRDASEHHRLLAALRRSAERVILQAAALEAAANGIVITDRNCVIEWVNPAFTGMTGYTGDEAVGKDLGALGPGAHDDAAYRTLQAAIAAGRPWRGELVNCRKDGTLYPEEQAITPVLDQDGRVAHFVAIKQDISKRRTGEKALQETVASFRHLFASNPLPMYVFDTTTLAFLAVNDAMIRRYGYSEGEFLAMTVPHIRPPDDVPRLLEQLERLDPRGGGEGTWRHTLKDGTVIDVDITTHALAFQGTEARLVVAQDITESLRAKRDLAASEERYRMLAENAVDVVFRLRVRPEIAFEYVSPSAKALTGYTPDEHYADPGLLYSILHPDDRPALEEAARHGGPMLSTARFIHRDGTLLYTEQHSRPVLDPHGRVVAVEGIIRNVTERVQTQQRADDLTRRLEAQVGRFQALHQLDTAILQDVPLRSVFDRILDALTNELAVDAVAIFRLDGNRKSLRAVAGRHLPEPVPAIVAGHGVAGEAVRTGTVVIVHDARTDTEHDTSYLERIGMRGCLAVPLPNLGSLEGALELFTRDPLRLDDEAQAFSEAIAHQLTLAVQRHTLLADLHAANLELDEALGASQSVINSVPANIAVLDREGTVVEVNGQWRAYGAANGNRDPGCGVGSNYLAVCEAAADHDPDAGTVRDGIVQVLTGTRNSFVHEYPCPGPGGMRWFRLVANDARLHGDDEGRAVVLHMDVTDQREARERLERMAYTDSLTDLPNRNGFIQRFDITVRDEGWPGGGVVLLMDIDDFGDVNDVRGYSSGNDLLKAVANRLTAGLRENAIVGRITGDTFAVFLPPDHPRDMSVGDVGAHVVDVVTARPYALGGIAIDLSVHVGITGLEDEERPIADLLREAELALHSVERDRQRHLAVYDPTFDRRSRQRIQLTYELRKALENNEFQLFYQPKVELATGKLTAAEALIRWNHPERGLLLPGAFLAVAEQSGLIAPIGSWVLDRACRAMRQWQGDGLDIVRVGVNVSVEQFRTGDFAAEVQRVIERHAIAPERLTLEITESAFALDVSALRTQLDELRRLGVHVALDDFGKGYSSLTRLKNFAVDELKIDYTFIHDMLDNAFSRAVVDTSIHLANSLGAEPIAEGIESAAQVDELIALGCPWGQGYYFSISLEEEDFRWLLKERATLPLPDHP